MSGIASIIGVGVPQRPLLPFLPRLLRPPPLILWLLHQSNRRIGSDELKPPLHKMQLAERQTRLLAGAIPKGGFGSTTSLKAAGYKSPNEKLNIASIGAGCSS